ncbi:acetyl-CoA hydrolase [Burkholderiaceae bacterium DAT-1]|nr:acetyl-CoA hydrolase [Burkholderiaceae bacterium DAT-1]
MARLIDSIEAAVDEVLDALPGDIVLGLPLGIGKSNPFVNALYRRFKAAPHRRLKIITALSLVKPAGKSEIEQHFLEPFVERVFGDYPDLEYARDALDGVLPDNVEVLEFFLKTGAYLHTPIAQQQHICTNYTFAARDMMSHGVNLLVQAVATRGEGDTLEVSMSSNPELTREALDRLAAMPNHRYITVAVANHKMPFMPNGAVIEANRFDLLVTDPAGTHDIFAPPNMKVSLPDYLIGLHASSLVKDGGTLQIGIGSLGDAIAKMLLVRDQDNAAYRSVLGALGVDVREREVARFDKGLYGCSEMLVNGFIKLIQAGVIRRNVYPDLAIQTLLNQGEITEAVTIHTLEKLRVMGAIHSPLLPEEVERLVRLGVLREGVTHDGDVLRWGARTCSLHVDRPEVRHNIAESMLGDQLRGAVYMHGGFFLGPRDFYQALREMPAEKLAGIDMTEIGFINEIFHDPKLIMAQRRDARLINTTMMVTLLGAAVSDGLEDGRVVSGVGGQYNFVAMGHALPGARSILLLRATKDHHGEVKSNIVWHYGHATIPRHLRDIVVTEYGVADLRGQPDHEVVKRLLKIADSRFQPELMAAAKQNGKLEHDWHLPDAWRHNTPEGLKERLEGIDTREIFPAFPFGTDFTADELAMIGVLQKLKHAGEHPLELVRLALKGLFSEREAPPGWLARLGLDEAHGLKQLVMRKLFLGNI